MIDDKTNDLFGLNKILYFFLEREVRGVCLTNNTLKIVVTVVRGGGESARSG